MDQQVPYQIESQGDESRSGQTDRIRFELGRGFRLVLPPAVPEAVKAVLPGRAGP